MAELPPLEVSEDDRHLVTPDGEPFFYLGDTAWALFHRLDREAADHYLADRAEKGFTVIQAVVLSPTSGVEEPNAYGDHALHDEDPAKPNEAFFEHVDYVVDRAAAEGLYVAMLPTWGNYWKHAGEHADPIFDPENARAYGEFLGERYRDSPVLWLLGGDQTVETETERETVVAMAEGVAAGDGDRHLRTFHPRGPGHSSYEFHDADWLDFNMIQSSHPAKDHDNGLYVERDYEREPTKPTVDGEPRYEGIPVGFYWGDSNTYERFDAYDVRQAAYWAVLAGAFGHCYGDNNVMQMWEEEHEPGIHANVPWREAINHPGARQMGFVRRLFESRPWQRLEPDQVILVDAPDSGGAKVRAATARDGSFTVAYSPRGEQFTLEKNALSPQWLREIWYDPRYGTAYETHTTDNQGVQTYDPPTEGRGEDWVLIVEDRDAEWPLPDEVKPERS
ncbi:MAG: glycoside hydrolase family 140 protein [Halobacteriaceae archaeon]